MDDLISRQAAINVMCELMHHWFGGDSKDEIREIKRELEKLPSAHPSFPQRHENDCISRMDAIDAVRDNESENYITINNLIDKDVAVALLEDLPSAQPTHDNTSNALKSLDCIDRQTAIDALCKAGCGSGYCGISCEEYKAIENLPSAQPEQRWIPVTERLPENRVYVLVTYRHEYGLIDHGITWYGGAEKKWNTSRDVLAWMPLPEPWKEGEAEC